jgi:hypothetical protein
MITRTLPLSELIRARPRPGKHTPSDLFSSSFTGTEKKYACYWYNDDEFEKELPNVIVPLDGSLEDLFADVATYYTDNLPLSAYVHIVNHELYEEISGQPRTSPSYGWRVKLEENKKIVWIALAVAESLSNVYLTGGNEDDVTYSMCRRSLAYSLARASVLYERLSHDQIVRRWIHLRAATKMDFADSITESILWVSNAISGDGHSPNASARQQDKSKLIKEIALGLLDGSTTTQDVTSALTRIYPGISLYQRALDGDFDSRIPALEGISRIIYETAIGKEIDALAIAYFANQILPGSFAYIRLLARKIHIYPSILVWYGLFSALSPEFNWKTVFSGLGHKLGRDIEKEFSFSVRPSADISLEELKVLSRVGLQSRIIKPAHQRSVLVSILPGVELLSRLVSESDSHLPHEGLLGVHENLLLKELAERDKKVKLLLQQAQELLSKSPQDHQQAGAASHTLPSHRAKPRKLGAAIKKPIADN